MEESYLCSTNMPTEGLNRKRMELMEDQEVADRTLQTTGHPQLSTLKSEDREEST